MYYLKLGIRPKKRENNGECKNRDLIIAKINIANF